MKRRLFEDLVVSKRMRLRGPFSLPASIAVHAAVLGAAVAFAALGPADLPATNPVAFASIVWNPPSRVLGATTLSKGHGGGPARAPRMAISIPTVPDESVANPTSDSLPDTCFPRCGDDPGPGSDFPGPVGGSDVIGDAPGPRRVRSGGDVQPPRKLFTVMPVYPEIALRAHMEGTVVLECIIATDGRVKDVTVLQPIPLLDQAAVDAVKQWRYTPTLLDGSPVEVIMSVTVHFRTPSGRL
jgi:periplasmic protein TonB